MKTQLAGKIAFITGGAKGIGKAIALKLAEHGATIIIHYNTSLSDAESTVAEIREKGGRAFHVQSNFADHKNIEKMFNEDLDALLDTELNGSRLDVLVNNAGLCEKNELSALDFDTFFKMMSVNFFAPINVIKESLPRFNDNGRIINISSVMAKSPDRRYLLYGASKAALNNLTLALVNDFGKRGITINTISPGLIPTKIMKGFDSKLVRDFIAKNTALRRVGTAEDIANLVLLMSMDKSSWITGQVIEADGGYNK
jgi:3-oxoacyl-[acyl-carrier protein] reductase